MHVDHTDTIIAVKNVSFSYDRHEVLHQVSLDIHRGDYLAIIGPNGGGKTTLLKIILGLLQPKKGFVSFYGTDIREFSGWHSIGYIAQKLGHLDPQFPATVEEVVSMGLYAKKGLFRWLDKQDNKKIAQALEQVDMWASRRQLIGELSGGQQQRVFIARALVAEPNVLFLDEPTVGIDVNAQEKFYTLLHRLNHELNITLVLVSHDIDVVAHEATEFACINNTIVYHGPPTDFIKGDYLTKLYGKGVKFVLHGH